VHGERNADSVLGLAVLEGNYGKKRRCFVRAARKLYGCGVPGGSEARLLFGRGYQRRSGDGDFDGESSHGFSPEYPELRASLFAVGAGITHQRNPGVLDMRQRCGCICLGHSLYANFCRGFHTWGDELLNFGHFSGSNYTILVRVAPKWSRMNRARNVTAKATGKKVLLR
jgi:hypothetical protein